MARRPRVDSAVKRVLSPIRTELIGPMRWQLIDSFEYRLGSEHGPEYVRVMAGFETDFASIPRPLWWLFPPVGASYTPATLVHDCLYKTGTVCADNGTARQITRHDADDTMREVMEVCGVGWWTTRSLFHAVRLGGAHAWAKHRRNDDVTLEATR